MGVLALALAMCGASASAQSGALHLVTYGAPGILGQQGNRDVAMGHSAISGDGRYTVFSTASNNLVANDPGRASDVFVADAMTGELTRISRRPDGGEPNDDSYGAAISADGRWVAFQSRATDLTPTSPDWSAIYLHDRVSGETRLLTHAVASSPYEHSHPPAISADGGVVAFVSNVRLVAEDVDDRDDAYAYLRASDSLVLLNRRADGSSLGVAESVAVSADGRYVSFDTYSVPAVPGSYNGLTVRELSTGSLDHITSPAGTPINTAFFDGTSLSADGRLLALSTQTPLLPIDTNARNDVYLFDRLTREIELISVSSSSALSDHDSRSPSLSADGTLVAFASRSTTFHPGADGIGNECYLRRRATGTTILISRPMSGALPSGTAGRYTDCSISLDGGKVAFASAAAGLVKGDSNRRSDAFVADVATGSMLRASVSHEAPRLAGGSSNQYGVTRAFVSADGREVVFSSSADNLMSRPGSSIFRHDLLSGLTGDAIGFSQPDDPNPYWRIVDAVSDDGHSVLFHREPVPSDFGGVPPPPPNTPWDLWLSSPVLGSRRVDASPLLPPNPRTELAVMSGNARRIAYVSVSFVPGSGFTRGVYVFDLAGSITRRGDTSAAGVAADASPERLLGLSHNGRFLAFASAAKNLVPENSDGRFDLYLRDLDHGGVTRIVQPGTGASLVTSDVQGSIGVSDDGNVLAFSSGKTDLVATLVAGHGVFRLDRSAGELLHLSQRAGVTYDTSDSVSMSADGRKVAFRSDYDLLFDGNGTSDVYVFDAATQTLSLGSADEHLTVGDGYSGAPYLTPDGEVLVFSSVSSNWDSTPRVVGDTDVFLKFLSEPSVFRSGFEY